jgi:hypothetical protein
MRLDAHFSTRFVKFCGDKLMVLALMNQPSITSFKKLLPWDDKTLFL